MSPENFMPIKLHPTFWTALISRALLFVQGESRMSDIEASETNEPNTHPALRAIGWVSVGVGIATIGLVVGRELRKRYKFAHRTPYDFYSNAGAPTASEFGMGI